MITTDLDRFLALARACVGGQRFWWVVVAGWVMMDFVSPRLFDISTIFSAFRNRNASDWPPRSGG